MAQMISGFSREKKTKNHLAIHIIADFVGCPREKLANKNIGIRMLRQTVKNAKLNAITIKSHQFVPAGYTAFAFLEESHISIHTWPEKEIALLDIFTCGSEKKAKFALKTLQKLFCPRKTLVKFVKRGTKTKHI